MSRLRLKRNSYAFYDSEHDSDDTTRYPHDNEFHFRVDPVPDSVAGALSLREVWDRVKDKNVLIKKFVKNAPLTFLGEVHLNLERNRILLRRALRRCERQREAFNCYLEHRNSLYLREEEMDESGEKDALTADSGAQTPATAAQPSEVAQSVPVEAQVAEEGTFPGNRATTPVPEGLVDPVPSTQSPIGRGRGRK